MKINPQTANIAQQAYSKNQSTNNADKAKEENNNIKESVSLNISTQSENISSQDLDSIQERIQEIANKLQIDFAKESENFSKANVNFFEGSFLTAQSSINKDASNLLS